MIREGSHVCIIFRNLFITWCQPFVFYKLKTLLVRNVRLQI